MKRAHLAPGMGARALVSQACRDYGLGGEALAVNDYLDVGPLADDAKRTEWWKPVLDMYMEGLHAERRSLQEQWSNIAPTFEMADEIVIWSSDSAHDQTHLRYALEKLENYQNVISLIHVPMSLSVAGVSRFYPDTLAACAANVITLSPQQRDELAHDYRVRLNGSEGVRYQTDNGLELRNYDTFDQAVLEACPFDFVSPVRVIGLAMSRLDGRNWVGDAFLRWRLRHLVDVGLVKATGTSWLVDDCDIQVCRR